MEHRICDACETVNHCRVKGCIPLTPLNAPAPSPQAPARATPLHHLQLASDWRGPGGFTE